MWKYFGTILFTEQMLIYLRYIFSMSIFCLFVVVIFKWPHSYLHLRKRWIKMVRENIAMYLCCWCCFFVVKMTVRNLFCCHRTVEECIVEDPNISPSSPYENVATRCRYWLKWCCRPLLWTETIADDLKRCIQKGTQVIFIHKTFLSHLCNRCYKYCLL